MAGLTDAACRRLMARHGAIYTISEMVSAKALTFGDRKSRQLMRFSDPGAPYGIQLFGSEPETLAAAVRIVREEGFFCDFIDINMGCPAPKITSSGAGSRLMLDPELCGRMVEAAVRAAGPLPVTVKMRVGWDDDHLTAVEVAQACRQAGAAALAVHGRTREQMYVPGINFELIRKVKESVDIPVLGNGDITTAEDALEMRRRTGCDAVMVGRGALGNPWLFEEIADAFAGRTVPQKEISLDRRMRTMREQVYQMCEEKGEYVAMAQARSQCMYYMRGLRGAASLRRYCSMLEHFQDVDTLIDAVFRCQE